jgi:hypothetical protein
MPTDNDRTRAAAIRAANASDRLHARAKLYGAIREILSMAAGDVQQAAIDLEDAAWHLAGCPSYPPTAENLRAQPVAAPAPGPVSVPDDAPTAPDDAAEGLPAPQPEVVTTPAAEATPAADIPPLDAVATPGPAAGTRTRRGRGRKNDGDGEGQAPAPDAATDAEAREQVAQVLGDPPAPRDVTADLFGAPVAADGDDFPPL